MPKVCVETFPKLASPSTAA